MLLEEEVGRKLGEIKSTPVGPGGSARSLNNGKGGSPI